eukprot:548687-Pleurochrysis_carterae.AAC.1
MAARTAEGRLARAGEARSKDNRTALGFWLRTLFDAQDLHVTLARSVHRPEQPLEACNERQALPAAAPAASSVLQELQSADATDNFLPERHFGPAASQSSRAGSAHCLDLLSAYMSERGDAGAALVCTLLIERRAASGDRLEKRNASQLFGWLLGEPGAA